MLQVIFTFVGGCGGIGRRARLRIWWLPVQVQVLSPAPGFDVAIELYRGLHFSLHIFALMEIFMWDTFLYTLTPVIMLFTFMAIGFTLTKTKILPDNSNKTIAKLETWVFCPALSFITMANNFTLSKITDHATNLLFSAILVGVVLTIGTLLAPLFVKNKCYERGIYQYALAFANFGYMGDPLVEALFGFDVLCAYKLFCLPCSIAVYVWGISVLTPREVGSSNPLKRLLNAPTVAMLLGMLVGITGTLGYFPSFITDALNMLKSCMGPVAMILAGGIIAKYEFGRLLKNKKVYVATILRLILLPAVIISALVGIKAIANYAFGITISNAPIYFSFFVTALPLGMNTVVFPEAYGGDPEPGASMAMISSALSVITIPVFYSVLSLLLEVPFTPISI